MYLCFTEHPVPRLAAHLEPQARCLMPQIMLCQSFALGIAKQATKPIGEPGGDSGQLLRILIATPPREDQLLLTLIRQSAQVGP